MSNPRESDNPGVTPLAFHELTKHHPNAYAPGPATLDWDAQPDPFRRFDGAPRIELPLPAEQIDASWPAVLGRRVAPAQLNARSVGALLELALGISAWKSNGVDRWAVRCNPSSGNLHPVEGYVVLPGTELGPPGLYHYDALDHALELRCVYDHALAEALPAGLADNCLLLGLSLIPWRECWKYGVRAWRYCQLDLGHAVAALGYAAGCLGWRIHEQTGWEAGQLAGLLGLDRAAELDAEEPEYPAALLMIGPEPTQLPAPPDLPAALPRQQWHGVANRLDQRHLYRWDAVDEMARNAAPCPPKQPRAAAPAQLPDLSPSTERMAEIIRTRRSTRTFDPGRTICADAFYRLLDLCRPRPGIPPWDERQSATGLHLLLFVHRVDGLPPGMYLLAEDESTAEDLRTRTRPELAWEHAPGCPDGLPCYLLVSADARKAAMQLGCHQQICAESAFALAMLADLETGVCEKPGGYERLFREAGRIGQVLYVTARAEGIGSSGIGCFFDDPIRELLAPGDLPLQPLYMFTVGPGRPELGLIDQPPYPARSAG